MIGAGYNRWNKMNEDTNGRIRRRRAWVRFSLVPALILLAAGLAGLRHYLPGRVAVVEPTPPSIAAVMTPGGADGARGVDGKMIPTPTSLSPLDALAIPPVIVQKPVPERARLDLERLYAAVVPVHDYFQAAVELAGFDLGDRQIPRASYEVGDRAIFNTAGGSRQAELIYRDDLAYYWVETGLALDQTALAASTERLRTNDYPLLVRTFGTEWRPGVDGDPRFSVLHVLGSPDDHELGYFIDENSYPATLFSRSNVQEMIYLNMSRLSPGTPLYEGTLAHEVQHLIQWNLDANEDTWLNEGLSQIAETLVGLDTVNPRPYQEQTNIRLDRWPANAPDITAHYAGSYLYLLYLWEQAGDAALRELARHPANGLAAVRAVLAGHRPGLSLETFTADWATANYLDGSGGVPPHRYERITLDPPFYGSRARQLPYDAVTSLDQFAVDYIDLDVSGRVVVTFAGDSVASLIDAPPPAGDGFWYAVPANSGRAQLATEVDLSGLKTAALDFDAWYDLEEGFDFAYITLSTDGGRTWEVLHPQHEIPGSYGPALGGRSAAITGNQDGWLHESVSLERYAGQTVTIRIEAITDFEITGRGLAVANPVISGLATQPAWQPAGFAWTGATLPQPWAVRVIRRGPSPEVFALELDELNRGQIVVELGDEGGALMVVALNPFVDPAADYWLRVSQ